MRRTLLLMVCAASCALPPVATAAAGPLAAAPRQAPLASTGPTVSVTDQRSASALSSGQSTSSESPIPVPASDTPPAGRRLSANRILAIAGALSKMRAIRREYPGSYGGAYLKLPFHWQVSYFSRNGKKEIGQVIIDDASGRVLEQWTGFQVPWTMARGYPGAFGRHVSALYVWLPLCVLFLLPFIDFRRPFSLLHLDLLVLLSLSVSLAFFNHGNIYASVPTVYPPLVYLLARMLALSRSGRSGSARPLRLLVPAPWLALGVVFLIGFRIALNVTDSNVIDVGYAGVIGAQRIVDGKPLYGSFPTDNQHGDTYGPVNYEAYVPFQQIFGWNGTWGDLPAAHAAAIVFDLLAVALIFLLGRRVRGPTLGIALAYAWVSYPFTLFALESNSNDTLVAVLVLAALLAASTAPARGVFAALAGLTKFAPLALVPLLATHGSWRESAPAVDDRSQAKAPPSPPRARGALRGLATFFLAFLLTAALVSIPALSHDSLHTIYERTIAYQANRGSPFSVWGIYGGLGGLQRAVQVMAAVLAVSLALVGRNRDVVGLAAACAA
ncbi:MAG: glycosyltransferase 87 family protein, partial [Solirubrobacterales bacterium]